MMITPGSFFLVLIIGITLLNAVIKKSLRDYKLFILYLLIIFSLYINIGYFISVKSVELTYAEFLTVILLILGFDIKDSKDTKTIDIISLWLFIEILLSIIIGFLLIDQRPPSLPVMPISGSWDLQYVGINQMVEASFTTNNVLRLIRIILFFLLYAQIDKYFTANYLISLKVKRFVVYSAVIYACLGIIEQIIKVLFHSASLINAAAWFFGRNFQPIYFERAGLPVLQGISGEPSHFAYSFLPAILLLTLDDIFSIQEKTLITILISWVLIFSGSFLGSGIFLALMLLYFLNNKGSLLTKTVFFSTLAWILFSFFYFSLIDYYFGRATALFTGENLSSSEAPRFYSITYLMKLFWERPLFGVGFGTTTAHGFLPSLLANLGIIGSVFWGALMLKGFIPAKIKNIFALVIVILLLIFSGDIGEAYSIKMLLMLTLVFRSPVKEPLKVPDKL